MQNYDLQVKILGKNRSQNNGMKVTQTNVHKHYSLHRTTCWLCEQAVAQNGEQPFSSNEWVYRVLHNFSLCVTNPSRKQA
jgi:hypothetical protein